MALGRCQVWFEATTRVQSWGWISGGADLSSVCEVADRFKIIQSSGCKAASSNNEPLTNIVEPWQHILLAQTQKSAISDHGEAPGGREIGTNLRPGWRLHGGGGGTSGCHGPVT